MLITSRRTGEKAGKKEILDDAVFNLQYSDINISMTTCDKILGIQVDDNMTWNSHFNFLSKKLSSYVAFE